MTHPLLRSWIASTALTLLALAALPVHALFKIVGPDGRVTYSDRPPPGAEGRALQVNRDGSIATNDTSLPYALRQVMAKFPVTLYTAEKCEACEQGRALLTRRGVPFAEKTATSDEDRAAWQRLVGGEQAPVLMVGAQVLRGYTPTAWEETLDVAGYSRQSQLPPNYKPPPAQPLVERRPATPPPAAAPTAPAIPAENPSNPSGIRF
jgi:glutaredoxin